VVLLFFFINSLDNDLMPVILNEVEANEFLSFLIEVKK
jgi:hypothetical protein